MNGDEKSADPLQSVLGAASESSSQRLREAVLRQTLGVVRRRRRVRQLAWAGALAACYTAGVLTMHWMSPSVDALAIDGPQVARFVPPVVKTSTIEKSLAAEKTPSTPYDSFRRQGDRELRDPRRVASAVGRYSRAMALASADQKAIDPEKDSWLLMALKLNQPTEKSHVRQDD